MSEYLSMGGYAAYVWPSYGVAALVLVGLLITSLRGLRRREVLLQALEAERPRRRRRAGRDMAAGASGAVVTEGSEG